MHLGDSIRRRRKQKNLTIGELADAAGLSQGFLSRVERGERALSMPALADVAAALECSQSDLLSATLPPVDVPVREIEVIGEVQGGVWREALEWPEEDRFRLVVHANPAFAQFPQFGLVVKGTSMNELYPHGTIAVCVRLLHLGRDPRSGEKVVVLRRSDHGDEMEATIKEFRHHADGSFWLWPRSTDPAFQQPLQLLANDGASVMDDALQIFGLVVSSIRNEA